VLTVASAPPDQGRGDPEARERAATSVIEQSSDTDETADHEQDRDEDRQVDGHPGVVPGDGLELRGHRYRHMTDGAHFRSRRSRHQP